MHSHGRSPEGILSLADEVFQVCYFLQVYAGLRVITVEDLLKMIGASASEVARCLELLLSSKYLEARDGGYMLTRDGVLEAERRFSEEFRFFHRGAHGICNDPNCECHSKGPGSCDVETGHRSAGISGGGFRINSFRIELKKRVRG